MASFAGSKGGISAEVKAKLRGMRNSGKGIDSDVAMVDVPQGMIVEGDNVYEMVCGGPDRVRGYVKDGVAYEMVCGGPDRPISGFRFG